MDRLGTGNAAEHDRTTDEVVWRLRDRDANFLALMKRAVFDNPSGPYVPLLRMAGCEYGDFESSGLRDCMETALLSLQSGRIGIGCTWTSVPNAQFAGHAKSRLQFSAEGISAALVTARRSDESFHPGAFAFYRDMGWGD